MSTHSMDRVGSTTLAVLFFRPRSPCSDYLQLFSSLNSSSFSHPCQPCKRLRRLMRTQSMIEMSKLELRGYTKNLFTQLHIQDLSSELEWWLMTTHQSVTSPVYAHPLPRIYQQALESRFSYSVSSQNVNLRSNCTQKLPWKHLIWSVTTPQ